MTIGGQDKIMRKISYLIVILLTSSCSDISDTLIICDCVSDRTKNKYTNRDGKYLNESYCQSEITGQINEKENKLIIKKDNWYLNFFDYDRGDENIFWQDTEISASGVSTEHDANVLFNLNRINLKATLYTTWILEEPKLNIIKITQEQKYQCRTTEGV